MKRAIGFALAGLIAAVPLMGAAKRAPARPTGTVDFKKATLIVETNSTDGDAGLQPFVDHAPWKSFSITRPDGQKILDVRTKGVLKNYGLTALFSESSEPPFAVFPFEKFKKLFPEGRYTFTGVTIDGTKVQSKVILTHNIPDGPEVTSPEEGSTVPAGDLVVEWLPVTSPAGIEIKAYQVIVVRDNDSREMLTTLPADATSLTIPAEFLRSGDHKVEVLAIEKGGNQTLTEIPFTVA